MSLAPKSEKSEGIDPIDVHLGMRLRKLRSVMGLSQDQLGRALGLTFQQIQKYESGANRIAASRLYGMARVLNVPVGYFFEGLSDNITSPPQITGFGESGQEPLDDASENESGHNPEHRETLEFARVYARISNPKVRRRILDMMRAIADEDTAESEL